MKHRLVVSRRAAGELERLAEWIERENPRVAQRLRAAFVRTGERLLVLPEAVALYHHPGARRAGLRMVPVSGFPNHLVFYRIVGAEVRVVRVLHGARDIPAALGLRPRGFEGP